MPDSKLWLTAATDNLTAANESAMAGRWRTACSRAYYAVHNGAHAVLAHFDPAIRQATRSVSHGELLARLFRVLRAKNVLRDFHVDLIRQRLTSSYNVRVQADYKPNLRIDRVEFGAARASARELIELARRLTQ